LQYLDGKRAELDLGLQNKLWNKTTELEKSKGNTPRMRSYCRKHGIDDIPDLDIVWKKSHTRGIWKVGEMEVFVSEADD